MEIELSHIFETGAERLWAMLLDPKRMSECLPGMQSVEVISETEYRATIKIKIAFISAKFNVKTTIIEMSPPTKLVCECSGKDNTVGSSMKSTITIRLNKTDGGTELWVKGKADVFGRLGSLGLNPMRTKAERMWAEFCANVAAELSQSSGTPAQAPTSAATAKPSIE